MKTEFKPEDIVVTTFQTKKVGGWNLNGANGIQVIHAPTGKIFTCEEHRSQHRNRAACIDQLEEYLKEYKVQDIGFRKVLDDATEAGKIGEVPPSVATSEDFIKWLEGGD